MHMRSAKHAPLSARAGTIELEGVVGEQGGAECKEEG
jgi:hypothetical protein